MTFRSVGNRGPLPTTQTTTQGRERARPATFRAALAVAVLALATFPFCAISPPEDCSANGTCASVDATADAAAEAAPIVIANAPDSGADAPDATRATDADALAPVDAHAPVETSVSETKANLDASEAGLDVIEEPPPPVCDPTKEPSQDPCVLDEAYGVFVGNVFVTANEVDGESVPTDSAVALLGPGDGSKSNPYATIREALACLHGKSRIYVCNDVYSEAVTITTPVAIFGGLSCTLDRQSFAISWAYVGGAPRVVGSSPALAVRGAGAVTADGGTDASPSDAAPSASPALAVTIEDMTFSSPDAIGAGASSIAAWVDTANVNLVRVTLSAGRGGDGAAGANGDATPNYVGDAPVGGNPEVQPFEGFAGLGGINQCSLFGMSTGGTGGVGCTSSGTAGNAAPMPPTTPGFDGLPLGTVLADGGTVVANDPGADGLALPSEQLRRPHGIAAPAGDYGSLLASGWVPSGGTGGATGGPGQGGAGATDPLFNECNLEISISTTAGGGGGGAGGCGGSGGQGGSGGGASIALASLNSTVTLAQCVLAVSNAGAGGAGGNGQDGQFGGLGGNTSLVLNEVAAPGAPGGNGAGGSGGAGGTGGLAVGILFSNSAIAPDDTTNRNWTPTAPRAGGAGGLPGLHAGVSGMDGLSGAAGLNGTSAVILETN